MPLAGTAPALGASLLAAAGGSDPQGLAAWTGVASALLTWLPANCVVKPGLMAAAGSAVSGLAELSFAASASLGPLLALGAGSVDTPGIARWTSIGNALVAHLSSLGTGVPTSFVASPTGGPVTGVGTLQIAAPIPTFPPAAGSLDPAGVLAWLAVSTALVAHLVANGVMNSLGFASPNGGGPVTGFSVIT
jgi:hypothetical protein